jgi:hypothetical protein
MSLKRHEQLKARRGIHAKGWVERIPVLSGAGLRELPGLERRIGTKRDRVKNDPGGLALSHPALPLLLAAVLQRLRTFSNVDYGSRGCGFDFCWMHNLFTRNRRTSNARHLTLTVPGSQIVPSAMSAAQGVMATKGRGTRPIPKPLYIRRVG